MPRTRLRRHLSTRAQDTTALERRPLTAGATDLFGAVLVADPCNDPLATATVEYMGFNNKAGVNTIRGIGESNTGNLIVASDNGIDLFSQALTEFGALVDEGHVSDPIGSGTFGAVALATIGGDLYWGEDDGKIYAWIASSAVHIATITDFASGGSVVEWSLAGYSTTGDLNDSGSIRLLALGTDVAGLYDIDPAPGSPVTHSASNVTGGSTAQSFGVAVNNCGGIYHGEAGSAPYAITYRAQDDLNTAVSTGISGSLIAAQGLIPSALTNGCHGKLGLTSQASNVRYDGSSYSSVDSFTGWGLNVGSIGDTGGDWVNVISNTNEIIRINETQ